MMQMPKNTHPYMRIIYKMSSEGGASEGASRTGESVHTGQITSSDVSLQSPVSNWRSICQSESN